MPENVIRHSLSKKRQVSAATQVRGVWEFRTRSHIFGVCIALGLSLGGCARASEPVAPEHASGSDSAGVSNSSVGIAATARASTQIPPAADSATANSAPGTAPERDAIAIPEYVSAAISAPDRSDPDRALDAGRHPGQMLAFFGIRPGWRVGEIGAGGGYTTELCARIVGASGKVFAQNTQMLMDRFASKILGPRLEKPVNAPVVKVVRELDAPFPPEAKDLDAVLAVLVYHDTVWMKADRNKMNRAIFAALKHGGIYGIVDHSARDGDGVSVTETLHRIEEKVVRDEVAKAGFEFVAEAGFLKNPADPRDWNSSPKAAGERRGTSDRFVLKFRKP